MHTMNVSTASLEPLVDIKEVIPRSDCDQALFRDLHEVLERHGALRRFGITLLHQHFPIADDEILLETTDREAREHLIQPVKKSSLADLQVVETSWRLDTGAPIVGCVCVVDPDGHRHHVRHSDVRLKRDIEPLEGVLSKVLSLRPARYHYRADEFPGAHLPNTPQLGVMAQDVASVFPELVRSSSLHGESSDSNEYLRIDYIGLVPVMIAAVKEQQLEIRKLEMRVAALQSTAVAGTPG